MFQTRVHDLPLLRGVSQLTGPKASFVQKDLMSVLPVTKIIWLYINTGINKA